MGTASCTGPSHRHELLSVAVSYELDSIATGVAGGIHAVASGLRLHSLSDGEPMRIVQVSISKYRAFDQKATLQLASFTVLTGPNNLGKSTVLRALDLFFGTLERGRVTRNVGNSRYRPSEDYPKAYKRGRKWPTRIAVTLALDTDDRSSALKATGQQFPDRVELRLELSPTTSSAQARLTSPQITDSAHVELFSQWFTDNVSYVYIPATRAIERFRQSVFSELVGAAIHSLSRSKRRVEQVERFYADVAARIAAVETDLTTELKPYLPDVKKVRLVLSDLDLLKLVDVVDVQIDDGALTSLNQKGDGFKSVFAMSVLQYIAKQRSGRTLIFAIEEPESHLHSTAIYEVKSSLEALSKSFQTIITTHSPVLVQRQQLGANVIIGQASGEGFSSTARAASSLSQIRQSLGIKPQDNMTAAECSLIVEGATEERCFAKVLIAVAPTIGQAFADGRVRVINAGGATKMTALLRALARDVATCVALTDADNSGIAAKRDLLASGLISVSDVFSVPARTGCIESEFEDAFAPALWIAEVSAACGLACVEADYLSAQRLSGSTGNRSQKWSAVMEALCATHGKVWDDLKDTAKGAFAVAIEQKAPSLVAAEFPWVSSIAGQLASHLAQA